MKRPFAVIGITYLLSQAVAAYLGSAFALVCALTALLILVIYRFLVEKRNTAVIAVLITASIAMFVSFAYTKMYVNNVVPVEGQTAYIKGQIIEEPYEQYGRYYYVIKTESIDADGVRQKIKIRVSSGTYIDAEYSDVFEGEVCFTDYSSENSYTSQKRLLAKGILATAYLPGDSVYTISSAKGGLYSYAISFRNTLKDTINDLYPDETGDILIAMMTGDEGNVDNDIISAFRNTGLAHIIAVSGLHLSLLALAVTKLLRKFLLNRKIIAAIVCAICWFYVAVAGFPMSAVRAAVMITVMLFGVLVDRLHTPLNSLGLAVLVICLTNPYAAIDAGLLMSFSSTFGLLVAAPEINRYLQRVIFKNKMGIATSILRNIVSAVTTSLTAGIFILPASVLYFGKVSLLSPITNLCLISLSELFLGLGMITVFIGLFGSFGRFIAYPIMAVNWLVGKIILGVVELFDSIPGAVLNTGKNTAIVVFGCVIIGVIWGLLFGCSKQRKRAFAASAFCCVVITSVWFYSGMILNDSKEITVYNVGNAAMVMANDRKSAILLGAGGDSYSVTLAQYDMQDKGISEITALVLTDMSASGAGRAKDIIENMKPCEVFAINDGFYRDTVEYTANKQSVPLSSSVNRSVSSGSVTVSNLTDSEGNIWSLIECGEMSVIVCPTGGNCLECPFGYSFDALIMTNEIPACVTAVNAKAYIICAEYQSGAVMVSQLMARGLKNVYCTGINGNIELAVRDGRLYIGGENI